MNCEREWAEREFGEAHLGDPRRRDRLIRIATAVARRPAGTVTRAIADVAEREGAFRWLESDRIAVDEVAGAAHRAAAKRASEFPYVVVPVDQATLSVVDRGCAKGFGPAGDGLSIYSRGLEVMSALAVTPDGVPLGLTAQEWWCRSDGPPQHGEGDRRPLEERESDLWRRSLVASTDVLSRYAPGTRPWFQLDRGGDFWRVFELADEADLWVTVRAAHDRRLVDEDSYLSTVLESLPPMATYTLDLPSRTDLKTHLRLRARQAVMDMRFAPVVLRLKCEGRVVRRTSVYVVEVQERGRVPQGVQPLHWRLLTTRPVRTAADAALVVDGYTMRWRIEDFHRTWKSGGCDVESSQLRSPSAFMRWATILATVAVRIERLKHLARNEGHEPATVELSRDEIDAAIIISKTKKWHPGDVLTIADAVELIARIGGYTGKSSGGPPGATVIGRGLKEVETAAVAVAHFRSSG